MSENSKPKARIAVIGCGWWSQGWHIPHLLANDNVEICALVDPSEHPTSSMNPDLEPLSALAEKCGGCPTFASVPELLKSSVGPEMDGALVCTPHATHYTIAEFLIQEGMERTTQGLMEEGNAKKRPLHIFLEKPMTTNVEEAKKLDDLVHSYWRTCSVTTEGGPHDNIPYFQLNHTANFREQAKVAKELVRKGTIGTIRHVNASMASPLSWLFGHPGNVGWNEPTEGMLGNGFAWGQSSHLLAWIYHVAGDQLKPQSVYCAMNHSEISGANLSHSATIRCLDDVIMNVSGTCLLPGNEHGDPPVGKEVRAEIYGTNGALFYAGNDHDPSSGRLELRMGKPNNNNTASSSMEEGSVVVVEKELGFLFENTDKTGKGPESLQSFIAACCGDKDYYVGADSQVGLKSIQTLDAMYRSQHSGNVEKIAYSERGARPTSKR